MKVFGICGYSGSGKTTLLEAVIALMTNRGLKVSLVKHAHHGFDIDRPGKDSWRHREAGAGEIALITDKRWVLMHEARNEEPPRLDDILRRMSPCDLVLLEGFKRAAHPKIEVHRPILGKPPVWTEDCDIVAVASDAAIDCPLPRLDLNDPEQVAGFILEHVGLK
ncbi:molybdopterin-guanine dinucleotide biosynthesis protein B [Denitratisoma sp. DHT3]|uniref:molybdopterin-guanine dinucleotide biosynthesis protein B n=1 Tax=Denitratisoma sp. DHT3 TaxID=1981880 RepID=UPI001198811F|nr:molybdopterin-guanine dinucleotide biosynthesis protein B [Denitratisoma sp. DHT3]QDX81026.1 molybdopterin-guanine dinucleotide biosynthesis protein B [Denitratisoma sp. DHT3]